MIPDDVNLKGYDKPFTTKQFAQYAMCTENSSEAFVIARRSVADAFKSGRLINYGDILSLMKDTPEFMNTFNTQRLHKSTYTFMQYVRWEMGRIAVERYGREWLRGQGNYMDAA